MQLSQTAEQLKGTLSGQDVAWTGVTLDSRAVTPGCLFVATSGQRVDGHDYIEDAKARGAVAALVERPVTVDFPTIEVKDTTAALGALAAIHRQQFTMPVVAITGSAGKTTTRDMIATILRRCGPTLSSIKSFNNHLGLPLTVLHMQEEHQFAVLEMGANHLHEIAYLTKIAQPDVALITNARGIHLSGFGDLDGVAKGKGEIFQGLKPQGVAVLNADESYFDYWKTLLSGQQRVLSFGRNPDADIRAERIALSSDGCPKFLLHTPAGEVSITLPLLGLHHVNNALAAAAIAHIFNVALTDIQQGLASLMPVAGRLEKKQGPQGALIIDDSYNASPTSLRAALQVLAPMSGRKVLVLGDMGELGDEAPHYHEQMGIEAREAGVSALYTLGDMTPYTVAAFGDNAYHFANHDALIKAVREHLSPDSVVLVKGSRFTHMEKVVENLEV